jgi:hypothetical protein
MPNQAARGLISPSVNIVGAKQVPFHAVNCPHKIVKKNIKEYLDAQIPCPKI